MMNNEYYIPLIEDFHIGFDYEYTMSDHHRFLDRTSENEWRKESFYASGNDVDGQEIDNISYLLDKNQIRVKYLDREDIENVLGVRQLKGDDVELNFQKMLNYPYTFVEVDYDTDLKELVVELFRENSQDSNYSSTTLFKGFCQNKSELKRILKQLNITL